MTRQTASSLPAVLATAMVSSAHTLPRMKAVPQLDMARFVGRWHEIARLPSLPQRLSDRRIRVDIEPLAGDRLRLRRTSTEPDGSDRVQEVSGRRRYPVQEPGQLQSTRAPAWLRWLPQVWNDRWVLVLDRQYQWAMIGEPKRRELWMLAREPSMERQVLQALKSTARGLGYDLAPLIISGELRSFQMV
jgi:apolipoprotein D and lipocalin family protein